MQCDMQTVDDGSTIQADLCIIGSGPAGMTLSNALFDGDLSMVVLESGDHGPTRFAESLNRGTVSGVLNKGPDEVRLRQVGGTANHWIVQAGGGRTNSLRFVPLQADDFDAWPISRADLDPYYERLHRDLGLGPFAYAQPEVWTGDTEGPTLTSDAIESGVFSFCATDYFTRKYPSRFDASVKHHLYRNATVSELVMNDDGTRVIAAQVLTPNGKSVRVRADHFVIASGGYGVPQLLLNSKSRHHPQGLGNNRDVVGRYYMDHSLVHLGQFRMQPWMHKRLGYYDLRDVNGVNAIGSIGVAGAIKKQAGLKKMEVMLFPRTTERNEKSFEAVVNLVNAVKYGKPPSDGWWTTLVRLVSGAPFLAYIAYQRYFHDMVMMPGLGRGGWSLMTPADFNRRFEGLELFGLAEQSPRATNRVTLSSARDALGIPRIAVHLDEDADDRESILKTEKLLVSALRAKGFGEFRSYAGASGKVKYMTYTAHHLMGTARMGTDPAVSVVDADCRIHGVDNCHVASSAVFPTGGYANATMTILALSLRLADRLRAIARPEAASASVSIVATGIGDGSPERAMPSRPAVGEV